MRPMTASDPAARPPRAAATLIPLRDSPQGPQVLMLRRHDRSKAFGGAFVFPGGKVDAQDAALSGSRHLDAAAQSLHARLGENDLDPAAASAFYVAALRETFEESGLLLAESLQAVASLEQALAGRASGAAFNAMLAERELRLRVGAMFPWSRWVTPLRGGSPTRFDTRFFVARAPDGPVHCDDHETTEARWMTPRAALEAYWNDAITLAPPQIMTLAHLARHGSVDSVLAEASARLPMLIHPRSLGEGEVRSAVCYPGDVEHPERERVMPGPLRLLVRGRRFEPQGGFQEFFQ